MTDSFTEFPLLIGLLAAMIHVVAGPDHLAAVAPIALREKTNSWLIGLFWGIGHVFGMILIGVLFFYFRELIPVDIISEQSEKLVGLLLIVIGIWVFYRLARKRNASNKHSHIHLHQNKLGEPFAHYHVHHHNSDAEHNHIHPKKQGVFTAAGIGTVHGLAGVSHLIGLLPTMAFSKTTDAVLYLVGFAGGTIVSMILFSVILGFIGNSASKKNQQLPYIINIVAASTAIFVGLFWIYQTW